jgi:hypothetical protein
MKTLADQEKKLVAESAVQLLIICCHQNVFTEKTETFLLSFEGHLESFALLQNFKNVMYLFHDFSRNPNVVLRHARVQWNSGWKTLLYKLPLTQSTKTHSTPTGTRSIMDQ